MSDFDIEGESPMTTPPREIPEQFRGQILPESLKEAIEVLLLNNQEKLTWDLDLVDPDFIELACAYKQLTGWDVSDEQG